MNASLSAGNATKITEGWVPQNGGRGTLDILLKSIITIFLCCWTSVCVNVPKQTDTRWQRFWDKMKLAGLAILGPDFLLMLAIGQRENARANREVLIRFRTPHSNKFLKLISLGDDIDWSVGHLLGF